MKIVSEEQFKMIDSLHYEIENKLLGLVESLERKRDDGTRADYISDEIADYIP